MSRLASGDGRSLRARAKREKRRRMILENALRIFAEKGYQGTRISDIIAAAGIARGTFYLYFDSKESIFHELIDELVETIHENIVGVELGPNAPPVREQLLISVRQVLSVFADNPDLARVILRGSIGLDEEIGRKLKDFYERLHLWIAMSVANGRAIGFVADVDPSTVAWCILGSVRQVILLLVEDRGAAPSVDALASTILDFNLRGILAPSLWAAE